jgi:uncharacterized protein with FMN-binding domain
MKRTKFMILSVILIAVSAITLGCGSSTAVYTDGTYEGTSDAGMHEGLKVSVSVKDGKISEVSIIEHDETEGIGTSAFGPVTEAIVDAQSTDVDSVSGATKTSNAIKEAVDGALAQAK